MGVGGRALAPPNIHSMTRRVRRNLWEHPVRGILAG